MKIGSFSKSELIGVGLILVVISFFTLSNLRIALRRARDAQRRADIGAIVDAVDKFRSELFFFPPSKGGIIAACKGENIDVFIETLRRSKQEEVQTMIKNYLEPCEWGKDSLSNIFSDSNNSYMKIIPSDPYSGKGYSYLYLSNDNFVQVYAYLEGGKDEAGYREEIRSRKLSCGINICNFGKSYADIPLDKSIEEYENELRIKSK